MGFNIWTFLFEVINFVVLVYILHRLLYRPLHEAIDRRRQEDARIRDEAEAARQEAVEAQERLDASLAEIEARRSETFRQAREQATTERQKVLAEANQAADRRREEAEQAIRREREEALRSLRAELVQTAVGLADRLLREAADRSLQEKLVGRLIDTLRAIPDDERQHLRDDWQAESRAVVEAAGSFNGQVLDQLKAAVADLAGKPVDLTIQDRPELIGGARLRLGGHVWDASLADRLEQAREAVAGGAPA